MAAPARSGVLAFLAPKKRAPYTYTRAPKSEHPGSEWGGHGAHPTPCGGKPRPKGHPPAGTSPGKPLNDRTKKDYLETARKDEQQAWRWANDPVRAQSEHHKASSAKKVYDWCQRQAA